MDTFVLVPEGEYVRSVLPRHSGAPSEAMRDKNFENRLSETNNKLYDDAWQKARNLCKLSIDF